MSAAQVIDAVRRSAAREPTDLRDLATGVIARLLAEGQLMPGDLGDDGHVSWPTCPGEPVERIAREWADG